MRRLLSTVMIALCIGCSDASDIGGPSFKNLLFRVDVTGDVTLGPSEFRLILDNLYWRTTPVAVDQKLFVPAGKHTLRIARFESTLPSWCSQEQPSTINAVFTRTDVISGHFVVYCPPATGTGILQTTLTVQGFNSTSPYTFRLTRTIGITGTQSYTVTPGKVHEQELTAGMYRVDLVSGCGNLEPPLLVAVRSGETANLRINLTCAFFLPPGIP